MAYKEDVFADIYMYSFLNNFVIFWCEKYNNNTIL